ncbi:Reverse transcriptase (RNA-dependent DNA polymerase) [Popillia japonica]|uniref:Reverse transcriptase (RNA-dependent DNA polymerase) n=1 Tax=Popillia japonica TaxID=7064 RepID=A0AAW1LQV1_POPJA
MSGERNMTVTSGAAQGSILGPDLWNILYDNLLRIQMPEEVTVVGYADDIAVLISVRDIDAAQLKLNQAMRKIESWMQRHGLSLALHKTEIVILTKRRIETTTAGHDRETYLKTRSES